jgi:hypothetical protein
VPLGGLPGGSNETTERSASPPQLRRDMKMFGELRLVRALTDEQIAAMRDPRLVGTVRLPTIEDAVKAGGVLAGRREDIIDRPAPQIRRQRAVRSSWGSAAFGRRGVPRRPKELRGPPRRKGRVL